MKIPFHRLDCSRLLLISPKDTQPLVYRMTAKGFSNLCLFSPLRIWILLITKLVSIKIYWFYFDLIKVIMALISYAFILIVIGSWLIDIMRNSRLQCFRNFGMQTFHCANECIGKIMRSIWRTIMVWGHIEWFFLKRCLDILFYELIFHRAINS